MHASHCEAHRRLGQPHRLLSGWTGLRSGGGGGGGRSPRPVLVGALRGSQAGCRVSTVSSHLPNHAGRQLQPGSAAGHQRGQADSAVQEQAAQPDQPDGPVPQRQRWRRGGVASAWGAGRGRQPLGPAWRGPPVGRRDADLVQCALVGPTLPTCCLSSAAPAARPAALAPVRAGTHAHAVVVRTASGLGRPHCPSPCATRVCGGAQSVRAPPPPTPSSVRVARGPAACRSRCPPRC